MGLKCEKKYKMRLFITSMIVVCLWGCSGNAKKKLLHIVPYGYEGSLVLKTGDNSSMSWNKVNEDDYIVIEYKDGIGVVNAEKKGNWAEEKVLWRSSSGAYFDSIQFVNLGIKTNGTETVFVVVRQSKSHDEMCEELTSFLNKDVARLAPNWKPEGGKNQLGPMREYVVQKNVRYWYDL